MIRFAAYLRVSTTDKQDPSLSFPSQLEESRRRVTELGGSIVCEFFDEETGAHDDRPGWSALVAEARDREQRRFDGVAIYSTSRLSRDRVSAGLFERELRKLGVQVLYAVGAGDPTTAEGQLMVAIQQSFDEFERNKLKRETRRGMRQNTLAGHRNGGRAPYGYQLVREGHSNPARAKAGDTKSRLVPDPEQAPVVAEIFGLWVGGLGVVGIADVLNARGVPSPTATNPRLNSRGDWAKSTLHSLLRNPTYTGKAVWDRLDNATRREDGGSAPRRSEDEWTVCEGAHEALVSDEVFAAAQERLRGKRTPTGRPRLAGRKRGAQTVHLLSGMVRCASGHLPLSMYGNVAKGHTYYRCEYGRSYGPVAAANIEGHGVSCNCRESLLLPFVERFFAERVFGPMRLDLLAEQLAAQEKATLSDSRAARVRLARRLTEVDAALAAQVRGLEAGVDANLVQARIAELQAEKADAEAAVAALPTDSPTQEADPGAVLAQMPDLSEALRDANAATKRQVFDAFDLRVVYDKLDGRVEISATLTEAVAGLLAAPDTPSLDGLGLWGRSLRGWDSNPQPIG